MATRPEGGPFRTIMGDCANEAAALTANMATYVCRIQVMARGEPGLLYAGTCGAKTACWEFGGVFLGSVLDITSVRLKQL